MTAYYALYNKELGKFLSIDFKVYADMSSDVALKQNYTSKLSDALRRSAGTASSLFSVTKAIEDRFKTGKKHGQYQQFKDQHQIVKVVLEPTVVDCGDFSDNQSQTQLYLVALDELAEHYAISSDYAKTILNLHGRCEVAVVARTLKVAGELRKIAEAQGFATNLPSRKKNSRATNSYIVEVDSDTHAVALRLSLSPDSKAVFIRTAEFKQKFIETLKAVKEDIKSRTLPGGTKINIGSEPISNDYDD